MSELDVLARSRITAAIAEIQEAQAELAEADGKTCPGHPKLTRASAANGKGIVVLLECQRDRLDAELKWLRTGGVIGAAAGLLGSAGFMAVAKLATLLATHHNQVPK